ncbi:MAG TPA: deoxycytidine triphosphate deaminase [Candidatus Saccharimonadales bacterium]|nr:deoxycytidine triphosphate deaminase [Candidatus Saccharimonadales bacterium]
MSVYSNSQIFEAIKSGQIVFHPYQAQHINGSSIDVTLGEYFYTPEDDAPKSGQDKLYNPYDPADVDRYFGTVKKALPLKEHAHIIQKFNLGQSIKNIPADQPVIIMRPNERILAHTHEFIGIKGNGTSSMQARSTTGRNGIAVCIDAGWGDPGYVNRWTMEIKNMNEHEHVVLPVGIRIAQLVFYETGPVEGEYSGLSGKYQTNSADDLSAIIKGWKPEQMLPKAYKDEFKPLPAIDGVYDA